MAGMATTDPVMANNPGVLGAQPLPGETWSQFLQRTGAYKNAADPAALSAAEDAFKVQQLKNQETSTSQTALDAQTASRSKNLNDLASLLAKSNDTQFNLDIPGIANTAQNQGMLETSGFGQALANRRSQLTADSDLLLGKTAIANADTAANGIGDIATNANAIDTAGLQRTFSTEDQSSAAALAKVLAQYGVPAPAPQPSTLDKVLQYSGPLLSGAAALSGGNSTTVGANGITTAATGAQSLSHLCTHMKNMGLLTSKEVKAVRAKVWPSLKDHQEDYATYNREAPMFILLNQDADWKGMKNALYDDVMACETSEQAFQAYKAKCEELFFGAKVLEVK